MPKFWVTTHHVINLQEIRLVEAADELEAKNKFPRTYHDKIPTNLDFSKAEYSCWVINVEHDNELFNEH